jgi:hypothetical protein
MKDVAQRGMSSRVPAVDASFGGMSPRKRRMTCTCKCITVWPAASPALVAPDKVDAQWKALSGSRHSGQLGGPYGSRWPGARRNAVRGGSQKRYCIERLMLAQRAPSQSGGYMRRVDGKTFAFEAQSSQGDGSCVHIG